MVDDPNDATSSDTVAQDAERRRHYEAIGPYTLVRPIGAGGMGEVWLAEQARPVRRQAAIKIIKAGMDTARVVARFDMERQALAVMSHPAIAQVFDAGATQQGRPYFAMEYVPGEAITSYCSRHKLSLHQRISLFIQVCEGVHHAHQKGIIHRDLKPSNIMVTTRDDVAVPKIIDFGLAKATTHLLTGGSLFTEAGALVGTPEYMSPEQAEMTPLDVDTRTDVYALGVILYELLTGVLPFDAKRLRERGLDELRRVIRETEPPRPSSRVTTLAQTSQGDGSAGLAPADLARQLRGDLDWITLRCLEKDRTRRYGSVSDLAADLQRHLRHLPVLAGPPTTRYRVGKFVRRHRLGVAAAATFAVLLVLFVATTAIQARRIGLERDRANRAAATAEAVNQFLQNDLLAQAGASAQTRPDTKPDPDLKVRTALDRAATGIERRFATQPLVEASIRTTIGRTYEDLGLLNDAGAHFARAVELRRRELGELDAGHLESNGDVARIYLLQGKHEPAVQLLASSLATARRVLGEEDPRTVTLAAGLARAYMAQGKHSEAETLAISVLDVRRRVLGDEHPDTLEAMDALASLYWRQGKYAQAEPIRARSVELARRIMGEDHPTTLIGQNNLALLSSYQGKLAEAEKLFIDVQQAMRRVLGEDHIETLISTGNLGIVYYRQGRYTEAEAVFTNALAQRQRVLGERHPETLTSLNNLGVVYRAQGKYPEAERVYSQLIDRQRVVLGNDHPNVLLTMNGLALLYAAQGKMRDAERLYTETLNDQRRVQGEEHPDTLNTKSNLVALYLRTGRTAEAEPLAVSVAEVRRRVLGDQHPDTVRSVNNLGLVHLKLARYEQAESQFRAALGGFEKNAPSGWEKFNCQSLLGDSLIGLRRYEEAEPLVTGAYESLITKRQAIPRTESDIVDEAGRRILRLYRSWEQPAKAAQWAGRLKER